MKNTFNYLRSKKFLLPFIFVMVLNTFLAVVLLRVSFAQTQNNDFSSQHPVKVETLRQKGCPLKIMIVNVDNSGLSYQNINYSLQNLSDKPIRAYTLLGDGKGNGKIITNFLSVELFQPNKNEFDSFPVERETIKENETVFLSIDYVEFADGSSWGSDSQGKSKEIAGQREGAKAAIQQLKNSIKNQKPNSENPVASLLTKDIQEISVDVPNTDQSDEWKKGFRRGYKTVIFVLQREREQGTANLTKKLDEMEKIAN